MPEVISFLQAVQRDMEDNIYNFTKDGKCSGFVSPKDCRACSIKWLQREVSADET